MTFRTCLLFGSAVAAFASVEAQAAVLYTSGPVAGTINGTMISDVIRTTNSFTLDKASTITGFSFGAMSLAGLDTLVTSVNFGFSPTMDFVLNGTTTSMTNGPVVATLSFAVGFGSVDYDVWEETATIAPVTLAAGTYWFTLGEAVTNSGAPVFWDQNDAPGSAFAKGGPNPLTARKTNSFTLYGNAVPEPETWALMLAGFGLLGAAMRRRQANVSFA